MGAPHQNRTGPVGVALVGTGVISGAYLENLTRFPDINVVALTDLLPEVAAAKAEEFGIDLSGAPELAFEHPDVEIIINLTIPAAHLEVSSRALAAGKHVWTEKPLAMNSVDASTLVDAAAAAGLRLGCAPDTVLGAGIQTARRVIERGDIGVPQTGLTLFQTPGPESWHPAPEFLFQPGAGPLFDMGPYYLTTLVEVFGPAAGVLALSRKARATRVIGSGPKAGTEFEVGVPTHVGLQTDFVEGGASQSIFSFESPRVRAGFVEVTGTEATLSIPDPNNFDGELRICRAGEDEWKSIPLVGPSDGRGMGVLDMARSIRAGQPHRATGERARHVTELMEAAIRSADEKAYVPLTSTAPRSELLPDGWDPVAATL